MQVPAPPWAFCSPPSCVYGRRPGRFRRRCGAIRQHGDLLSSCIHTNHICLNDTSASMRRMKHVTQNTSTSHANSHCVSPHPPSRTALLCQPLRCARSWNRTQNTFMFTESGYTAKDGARCAIVLPLHAECLFVCESSGTPRSIIEPVSLKYDPGM